MSLFEVSYWFLGLQQMTAWKRIFLPKSGLIKKALRYFGQVMLCFSLVTLLVFEKAACFSFLLLACHIVKNKVKSWKEGKNVEHINSFARCAIVCSLFVKYLRGPSQPPPLHSRPFTHINPVSVFPSPSSSSTTTPPPLPLFVSLLLSPLPLRAPSA